MNNIVPVKGSHITAESDFTERCGRARSVCLSRRLRHVDALFAKFNGFLPVVFLEESTNFFTLKC